MIKNEKAFADALLSANEWWATGKSRIAERYRKKRAAFQQVKKEMDSKRIVIISGPRRVGKSVLLHQLGQDLMDSGVPRENIVYYQLDDPSIFPYSDEPLKDIIEYAQARSKGRLFVLLDEIQAYKEWYKWVKAFQDRGLDIKFVLSGSASLNIQADANKYLRGRTAEVEIYPLGFNEFLFFSGIEPPRMDKKDAASIAITYEKISSALEEYLLVGGFPEWFEIKGEADAKERWLGHLLADVPKKAIYEDIAAYFNIRNPKVIDLLLSILAANQSKILSYEAINEVVNLNRATLLDYIGFLKSSYLVFEIPVYGPPKKQMKAMKKFLLSDQGLRNALMKEYSLKEENMGFAVENVVGIALALNCRPVAYWKEQAYEVDFVAGGIPVEVKYRNVVDEKDCRGLLKFMEKYGKGFGVVITKDRFEERTAGGKRIRFVPFWMFLLDPKRHLS
jgi:predicted AAA+ superfamily ATPase